MESETIRIGELLRRLRLLNEGQLQECLDRQEELRSEGKNVPLGQVVVEMGFADAAQVQKIMAHGGTAILACPKCGHRYNVRDYRAGQKYRCGECKVYLEFPKDNSLAVNAESTAVVETAPQKPGFYPGRIFGKYKVLKTIGKGGMGMVYLVRRTDDGRLVALKVLGEQFSQIPSIAKRFRREAQAGGRLKHPNIVQNFALGRMGRNLYIASEFVDGPALEDLLQSQRKMEPERALRVIKDVLMALEFAHNRGIAHRDIKPPNVLLTSQGRAKLIDFGLAKDESAQTVLTMAGDLMGTPSYMSPEQVQGQRGGPMSDLYACGVLLFVMLTGKRPFVGRSMIETLDKHVREPVPSLVKINPDVPRKLEKVVHRLMAKEPAARYRSAAAAIAALEGATAVRMEKIPEFEEPRAAPETPAPRRERAPAPVPAEPEGSPWWLWVIVFAALFAALAVGAWFLLNYV
ncbi:MAG: protein kinase domain-containing protein [Planctomycetota bacterium]|jgi:predicted Ser/Thr protein kinase/predicted RNA-binding Zn-ribbon protein involved in translation (DUF1610 family)